jgi:hypothetical protein
MLAIKGTSQAKDQTKQFTIYRERERERERERFIPCRLRQRGRGCVSDGCFLQFCSVKQHFTPEIKEGNCHIQQTIWFKERRNDKQLRSK